MCLQLLENSDLAVAGLKSMKYFSIRHWPWALAGGRVVNLAPDDYHLFDQCFQFSVTKCLY